MNVNSMIDDIVSHVSAKGLQESRPLPGRYSHPSGRLLGTAEGSQQSVLRPLQPVSSGPHPLPRRRSGGLAEERLRKLRAELSAEIKTKAVDRKESASLLSTGDYLEMILFLAYFHANRQSGQQC